MSDVGYGQIGLDAGSTDLNAWVAIARRLIARLDTVKVVKVVAVHPGSGSPPAGGTVDVLPLVSQIDAKGNPTPHEKVNGLQYFRFQAGIWAIIADPVAGDIGLVLCADRDSSLAVSQKGQANPGSRRQYNVADGTYLGAIASANGAPTGYIQLNQDGTWNWTDPFGNVLQGASGGITATPAGGGVFKVNGNLQVTGSIIGADGANTVTLATHTHGGVQTGGGVSGPPTPGS